MKQHKILDFFGALFGVGGIDWDSDFASDGYDDYFGRKPFSEPLFYSDMEYNTPDITIASISANSIKHA